MITAEAAALLHAVSKVGSDCLHLESHVSASLVLLFASLSLRIIMCVRVWRTCLVVSDSLHQGPVPPDAHTGNM